MRPYLQNLELEDGGIKVDVVRDLCFPAHWHIQCELVYVLEGTFSAGIDSEVYDLGPGDFLAVGSNVIHYYTSHGSRILLILFHPDVLGMGEGWPKGTFLQPMVRGENITQMAGKLLDYMVKARNMDSLTQRGMVNLLCAFAQEKAGFISDCKTMSAQHRLVQEAIAYIGKNYREDMGLAQIADQVNISKYHFSRKFKEYTGMSIPQHINSVRLFHAEQMLGEGERSISDIAFACGFGSLRNFNRAFLHKNGVTPAVYRRKSESKRK